jgi:hypothetical protein
MTTFDDREEAFERQFAHDEELRFKAIARRNKLFGLWAAQKLGLSGDDAQAYGNETVVEGVEGADIIAKVRKDLEGQGSKPSDHQIQRVLDELTADAIAQIKVGK